VTTVVVRALTAEDWPAVEAIYREGIEAGNATFETEPPAWEAFDTGKILAGRLVAVDESGSVLGWIAASPVSAREAYRGVVEHSVYVSNRSQGCGVGSLLLHAFLREVHTAGVWTVQASVFPENAASLALHDRAGFRRIGVRERIALMTHGPSRGQWRDTILIEHRRVD